MKLSFDKAATRKIELWATAISIDIDDLEAIATEVLDLVETDLDGFRSVKEQRKKASKPADPTVEGKNEHG